MTDSSHDAPPAIGLDDQSRPLIPAADTLLLNHHQPGFMEKIDSWLETGGLAERQPFRLSFDGWKYEWTRELLIICLWYALKRGVPVLVAPPEIGKRWKQPDIDVEAT